MRSGMNVALCPLSMNVVRAKAARPSGAGSAAGTDSTSVRVGAAAVTAIVSSSRPRTREGDAGNESIGRYARSVPARKRPKPDLRFEVVRVLRQVLVAVGCDQHQVLQPHAAVALPVAARLDGDHVARPQLLLGGAAHTRGLVHLEADAMPEAVEETLVERLPRFLRALRQLPRRFEDLARSVEDRTAVDAVLDLRDR